MTRWARAGNCQRHQKIPGEATKWGEFDLQKVEQGSSPKNKNKTNQNSKRKASDFSPRKNVKKIKNEKKQPHIGMSEDSGQTENKIQNNALKKTENVERSHQQQNISFEKIPTKKRKRDEQNDVLRKSTETTMSKNKMKKHKNKKKQFHLGTSDDSGQSENKIHSKNFENYRDPTQTETENVDRSHTQQNIPVEKMPTEKRKKDKQNGVDSKSTEIPTSKSFENKKSKYLEKLQKKRAKNGILLLPVKVERKLYNIKRKLREKNLPASVIVQIIRKERRKEELKFRKNFGPSKMCFNCRQVGHILADCPEKLGTSNQGTGFCFKCGSKEHSSLKCPEKIEGFPLAKCFICKEQGHISKECPNNKHGIYPKGGRCNLCGNVNHLKKDCPTLSKKAVAGEPTVTLQMMDGVSSIDAEVPEKTQMKRKNVKKPKIVKF